MIKQWVYLQSNASFLYSSSNTWSKLEVVKFWQTAKGEWHPDVVVSLRKGASITTTVDMTGGKNVVQGWFAVTKAQAKSSKHKDWEDQFHGDGSTKKWWTSLWSDRPWKFGVTILSPIATTAAVVVVAAGLLTQMPIMFGQLFYFAFEMFFFFFLLDWR